VQYAIYTIVHGSLVGWAWSTWPNYLGWSCFNLSA